MVYEAVTKRRSIRRFQDLPVPYEALEKCVDAGRLAPSGRNRQLWEYVIVDDEKLLPQVFDGIMLGAGGAPEGHEPRAYIIILINRTLEVELGAAKRVVNYDVGFTAENMILVALEQGLGACPIATFAENKLKQILHIPEKYEVALVLALGYPDEAPVVVVTAGPVEYWTDSQGIRHIPKRKLADIVHCNGFSR